MSIAEEKKQEDKLDVDKIQFFKQETITNAQGIVIDVMVPVSISKTGKISVEKSKPKVFVGKTPVDMGGRVVPFPFAIDGANNMHEALHMFESCAGKAIKEANQRIKEEVDTMKEKDNEIIVPGNTSRKIITP